LTEVSGQINAPVALPPGNNSVPYLTEAAWASSAGFDVSEKIKPPTRAGIELRTVQPIAYSLCRLSHNLFSLLFSP